MITVIFHLRPPEILKMSEEVPENSQELSLVCTNDILFSDPGDDVVLSCHLNPAISAASMEIKWWNKEDLVCHYKDGQVTVSSEGRVSFSWQDLLNGNVSLTLRDVRRSQRGHYICEVIHESRTIKEYLFLRISSEDFSLVVPDGIVSADPGGDVILPVHLSPETSAVSMKIKWLRGSELIYQYKNRQEETNNENQVSLSIQELERGNLSLTLRNVQQSDSGKYTCKIIHDGCEKTGVVHLRVRELPDSQRQTQTDETTFKRTQEFGGTKRKYNVSDVIPMRLAPRASRAVGSWEIASDTIHPSFSTVTPLPILPEPQKRKHTLKYEQLPDSQRQTQTDETTFQETQDHGDKYEKKRKYNLKKRRELEMINFLDFFLHILGPTPTRGNDGDRPLSASSESSQSFDTALRDLKSLLSDDEQENAGATRTQEQDSESTEQDRFSPAVQSQVQEREETSQSVTAGDTTQTPEKPEDRAQ